MTSRSYGPKVSGPAPRTSSLTRTSTLPVSSRIFCRIGVVPFQLWPFWPVRIRTWILGGAADAAGCCADADPLRTPTDNAAIARVRFIWRLHLQIRGPPHQPGRRGREDYPIGRGGE